MKRSCAASKLKRLPFAGKANRKTINRYILFFSVLISSTCSTPTFAAYLYQYTGNPFVTTVTSYNNDYYPYDPFIVTREELISVVFSSPTLLSDESSLSSIPSFTITTSNFDDSLYDGYRQLTYPNPYANPFDHLGSAANPYNIPTFSILSVDSLGLPTDWNISIEHYYTAPTGRLFQSFIKTSTSQDSTYGGYEGYSDYVGQINGNSGQWSVVAVVPAPESYALMLTGLGLLGLSARPQRQLVAIRRIDARI